HVSSRCGCCGKGSNCGSDLYRRPTATEARLRKTDNREVQVGGCSGQHEGVDQHKCWREIRNIEDGHGSEQETDCTGNGNPQSLECTVEGPQQQHCDCNGCNVGVIQNLAKRALHNFQTMLCLGTF